jgi:hypothetical protein
MIARDIDALAWTMRAEVPDLHIHDTVDDPLMQNPVRFTSWQPSSTDVPLAQSMT